MNSRIAGVVAAVVIAVLAIVFLINASQEPKLGKGTIVGKVDTPAYDSTWLMPVMIGQSCVKSGTSNICTPLYTYIPMPEHHSETWKFKIQDGKKKGVWYVDQNSFSQYQVGQYFDKDALKTASPSEPGVVKVHTSSG